MSTNGWDSVNFNQTQSGPGGAAALDLGLIGGSSVQAGGALSNPSTAVVGAPGTSASTFPPILWAFVFIGIGYVMLHLSLRAV
jgi:hypothetical protein